VFQNFLFLRLTLDETVGYSKYVSKTETNQEETIMSEATNIVAELRAQLAKAEEAVKAERAAKRAAEKTAREAKLAADTKAYREENYELTAGSNDSYVGASTDYRGAVEISIAEWTSQQVSATLSREEALALAEGIQKLLK
jgi:outer membrane murein-binding lipoprotein Lpp